MVSESQNDYIFASVCKIGVIRIIFGVSEVNRMQTIISNLRIKLRKYPCLFKFAKGVRKILIWPGVKKELIEKVQEDTATILKQDKGTLKCWFVCVPSHGNLGDQAMAMANRRWISENYPEYKLVELSRESLTVKTPCVMDLIKQVTTARDIFFVQGGYTSGDKTVNEKANRLLASQMTENRIVFFPQTVFYTTKNELEKTAEIYNKHGNILFLARDQVSYKTVKEAFRNIEVELYPDTVSSLIGRIKIDYAKKRSGVLFCIREDSEKLYSDDEIKQAVELIEKHYPVDIADLMVKAREKTKQEYEDYIEDLIVKMSSYRIIVTDRFHGILFGMLSNTRVCAIDSIDFKVREGAIMFNALYPGSVHYAKSITDIVDYVEDNYQKENQVEYDDRCYKKFYKDFRDIVG